MDCNEHVIRYFCRICRLASIIVTLTCYASDNVNIDKMASEICQEADTGNVDSLVAKFDSLEPMLVQTNDPVATAREFLEQFIQRINSRYGVNLSLLDTCEYIKNNMDELNIPTEIRSQFLQTLDILIGYEERRGFKLYWPTEWNWFGLNKKDQRKLGEYRSQRTHFTDTTPVTNYSQFDGASIVGLLEVVAGTSIGIGLSETVIGPVIGGALVADGLHRIANKGEADLDEALRDRKRSTEPYPNQQ